MKICKKCGKEKDDKKPCKPCLKIYDRAKRKKYKIRAEGGEMGLSLLKIKW